jgi:hypothetical protein
MTCLRKHVKYEPPEEAWLCPKCHKGPDFSIDNDIDWDPALGDADCLLLHEDDRLSCFACGYVTNGKAFSALVAKKMNAITCPCCKGKGWVRNDGKTGKEASGSKDAEVKDKPRAKTGSTAPRLGRRLGARLQGYRQKKSG